MPVQYRHTHSRPNYIVHVGNSRFSLHIFDLRLFDSADAEPADTEGQLYYHSSLFVHQIVNIWAVFSSWLL